MENTNQNFIDSITPIAQQINTIALKIQHLSTHEDIKNSAVHALSNALTHYVGLLGDMTGIDFKSLEETLNP
jgi:hypothetical protein